MKIFYIADMHLGHDNIIKYDSRPFKTAEQMDEVIINNWNNAVTDEDTVYILGDISWYREGRTISILNSLAGKKVLIKGNHDRTSARISECYEKICDYLEIMDGEERVMLSHYPMPFWNYQFQDSVHLYGHIHNSEQWRLLLGWQAEMRAAQNIPARMFNVGCMMDYMNYTPRTLEYILSHQAD